MVNKVHSLSQKMFKMFSLADQKLPAWKRNGGGREGQSLEGGDGRMQKHEGGADGQDGGPQSIFCMQICWCCWDVHPAKVSLADQADLEACLCLAGSLETMPDTWQRRWPEPKKECNLKGDKSKKENQKHSYLANLHVLAISCSKRSTSVIVWH